MKKNLPILQECYRLLQNILQDTYNIQTHFFTPPYKDYVKADMGIRAVMGTDYNIQDADTFFDKANTRSRLIVVKSNLGFYNIVVFFSVDFKGISDFIAIGPFRDSELTANYFTKVLKESQISPAEIRSIKHIYERMPLAQVDVVVNVTRHILSHFFPEFEEVTVEFRQFSEQKKVVSPNNKLLDAYSYEYSELYRDLLFDFLDKITLGDTRSAKESLNLFLQKTMILNHKNMRKYKMNLNQLADQCHMALLKTSIHPMYVLRQTTALKIKIEEETSFARLEQMPNEICHKYCLLVKNYANAECSKLVRDVMAYIQFHFEDELTLHFLADIFKKNASVLSATFSREAGMSVTAYIQRTRIEKAINLFNTTDMSVAEVATAVGYQDFSYFSKIFTKQIGCSPRAYKTDRLQ